MRTVRFDGTYNNCETIHHKKADCYSRGDGSYGMGPQIQQPDLQQNNNRQ